MSKIGVQASDVWDAADRVLLSGQRPTIERVRLDLGRGSPNTVGPHLDAWYQQLGQRLQAATAPQTVDGSVPAALQSLLKEAWQVAQQQAQQRAEQNIQQIQSELAEQANALKQAQQDTARQQQQLQQREADLNAHIALLQEQLKLADQRLDESLRIQADKEVQLEAARRLQMESTARQQALEAEILRLRDEHDTAMRQLTSDHHRQLTRWMAEVDRARQEKKQQEAEFAKKLEALKQRAEQQEAAAQQARDALEKELSVTQASNLQHQQHLREALDLNQRLQQEREQLQQRLETLTELQRDKQELFTHLVTSLNASLTLQRAERQQRNAAGQEKGDELEQENTAPQRLA